VHNIAEGGTVSKRAWLIFGAVQMVGCILLAYGTMLSESAFVRGSSLSGFLLLLPGYLPAMVVGQVIHVRTRYVFFPVAAACNAIFWLMCSALWRILRRGGPIGTSHKYALAVAATALVFVAVNTILYLRPATCSDCFFPYGVPFTLYRDGGFAGGGGFVVRGLAADAATAIVIGLLLGGIWAEGWRPRCRESESL
jgi:hypothetical protein